MPFIEVKNVSKNFKIFKNRPGLFGAFISLFHREYEIKKAVADISFSIEKGEITGYIGPNGAGKSTTIKMLSGVLTPDEGKIKVGDIIPYKERKKNAKRIGVVFGQRSQLYWDLPVYDTFNLYQKLYEIPNVLFEHNKKMYIDLFDMGGFINQSVRQLSLGQKMKANLALAMLHDPDVLYLDEPTIGLDVMSKKNLRQGIQTLNREKNTTIILTTHDMSDIEAVCRRLIVIDHGKKIFDGSLENFKNNYDDGYMIKMEFADLPREARTSEPANRRFEGSGSTLVVPEWETLSGFTLKSANDNIWNIKVEKNIRIKDALNILINHYNPENISVHEQDIEDIIQLIFAH